MPLTTNISETKRILAGSTAISRVYPRGCPHKERANILLAYERPDGRMQVYAEALVKAVSEMPFSDRSASTPVAEKLARAEGFTNAAAWTAHMRSLYGGGTMLTAGTPIWRLHLNVTLRTGAEGPPQQTSEEDIPNVSQARVQASGEQRRVGSVDSLDDVAALERQMFGGRA